MSSNTKNKDDVINTFKFLKWSSGESYERTIRQTGNRKQVYNSDEERNINSQNFGSSMNSVNPEIYSELNKEMKKKITFNNSEFTRFSNKRNSQNEKLLQRDPIIQTNVNPFIQRSSYIDHIDKEDEFLRPKDSNVEYEL